MLGVNALDYFQEVPGRTWDQFLEFFDRMVKEQGTDLWAAAQTDPGMLAQLQALSADEIAELCDDDTSSGEPHRGYTPIVRELRNVADQMICLRAQLGRMSPRDVTFMPRPQMYADVIADRRSELTRADLDDEIAQAKARYLELMNP